MNKQGSGKIDWTDYTWNPITGCKHGCSYCYLKRLESRFGMSMEPAFHPDRLDDLKRLKNPAKIFVGSTADMWGEWVPAAWINPVLDVCRQYPQHTFQFLTKNALGYCGYDIPDNCWLGVTCDTADSVEPLCDALQVQRRAGRILFVSAEPLLDDISRVLRIYRWISWIIIGADSNRGSERPPIEWADNLIAMARKDDVAVFVKDNYGYPEKIKEFPSV